MGQIELKGIRKSFGGIDVIKGIDLQINEGELVIFVGPSGCGKSTLLRLISGLVEASDGQILIDGDDVTGKPPAERELSMVFQSYALYPHKSVRENMGFALTVAGMPKAEITQKVDEAAATLKLEDYLDRKPKALSGGQRQRVAIGRAIVREPRAFLFDEPLSNLDAALRVEMRLEIARLHQKLGATMVYVTHDQVEAMTLADKIVVLQAGQIEQIGTPLDLYRHPGNLFVAQFIGSPKMNVVDCKGTGTQLTFGNGNTSDIARNAEGATKMGIRPEHMSLCPAAGVVAGDAMRNAAGNSDGNAVSDAAGNAGGNVLGDAAGHAGTPANDAASNASNTYAGSDANAASDALGTPAPSKAILTGQIDVMEHLGSDSFAYVNVPDVGLFTVRIVGHSDAREGDMVGLHFASGDVHLFDASEKTIPA